MIYIHIPFCRSFCTYCGFYSELLCRKRQEDTVFSLFREALCNEAGVRSAGLQDGPDTLYIGGGTPSVLPPDVLASVAACLPAGGGKHGFREFTVEVNPEDIVSGGEGYVEALLAAGVNRISMGVQSFDDGILKWMNRRHSSVDAVRACGILRKACVRNISIDLIFGIPGMDGSRWMATLDRISELPGGCPEHISAYQLSVEPGSALEKLISRGRCPEVSDEECFRQYETLCRVLGEAGYRHYEVSNFALPGYEAVHNSAYWSGQPYLGLGPGAHSFCIVDGRHTRSWTRPSLEDYLSAWRLPDAESGLSVMEKEVLTPEQVDMERIMLALRTDTGLPEDELVRISSPGAAERQAASGNLVRLPDGNVRIPEDRFFVSDAIIASLV